METRLTIIINSRYIKKMKILSILLLFISYQLSFGQISEQRLDTLIQRTLKTFDVPGISVGIIKDDQIVYAKGFGKASLATQQAMNKNTLVGIASNSKAFTAVALAILADEGKLSWDDKVTKHIPEFQMYDPYVTREITLKDLITHRSGLGLGQGDLMFFPEGGTQSIQDIVHNVRYLKPKASFRNQLNYNNILYIVAGEVVSRISGKSWAEFIEERIMKPVGMTQSFGNYNRAKHIKNKIDAHAPINGKVTAIPHDWNTTADAAGGILSNVSDMLIWAQCLNNNFKTKDGLQLVSEKQIAQLWQIQVPSTISTKHPYETKNYGYGLGWFISDVKGGYKQVQHTGGLIGTVTQFTIIPDLKLGIIVLTNQQNGAAFNTITNTIKDAYLGFDDRNWIDLYSNKNTQYIKEKNKEKEDVYARSKIFEKDKKSHPKAEQLMGIYRDPWFGDIEITQKGSTYRLICKTSPRLKGTLIPYNQHTFIIQWDDRSYDADAFITFTYNENERATNAKIKPISDITDFSFDFEDLELTRVTQP